VRDVAVFWRKIGTKNSGFLKFFKVGDAAALQHKIALKKSGIFKKFENIKGARSSGILA